MLQIARTTTTITRRSLSRLTLSTLIAGALLVSARPVHAGTPEQRCLKALYTAAGEYAKCQQKAEAKLFGGGYPNDFPGNEYQDAVRRCRSRYTAVWSHTGVTCAAKRFVPNDTTVLVPNGTTVTDNLTGLQWEQKTVDATDVHDTFGTYSWSAAVGGTAADGTAFTIFLAALNDSLAAGGCFAGQCDWRLPTVVELQTICGTSSPCIDPIFDPVVIAGGYWSATTYASDPASAWIVSFNEGSVLSQPKSEGRFVRAVRGGL